MNITNQIFKISLLVSKLQEPKIYKEFSVSTLTNSSEPMDHTEEWYRED